MKRRYLIYFAGCKNPAYTYKTSEGFYARLRKLAALHSITKVYVHVTGLDKWYVVNLNPSPAVTWSSREMGKEPTL